MRQSIEFGSQKSRDTAEKLKNIPAATDTREDFERESGSIETEESRRVKVLNYIAENLSPAEERISTPMDKNCKVAVVVPAYGERHAILRMIKSLAQQDDVAPDEYELVVVVNNPALPPERLSHETAEDFARKSDQFNRATTEN